MPGFDPMCRIFGNKNAPISGVIGPKMTGREVWPYYTVDEKGMAKPEHFDDDNWIQVYEEMMQLIKDSGGVKLGGGMAMIAIGLGAMYNHKAGVDKDVACYDKALEYYKLSQECLIEMMGRSAKDKLEYQQMELMIGKIGRKKQRRLAKQNSGAIKEAPQDVEKSPKVIEVRVARGEEFTQIVFLYEDGTVSAFDHTSSSNNRLTHDMNSIDDDESGATTSFVLEEDEYIVGLLTHEKQQQGLLNSLTFCTNKGRRSEAYDFDDSNPKGRQYQYWATTGCHIVGFKEVMGTISVPVGTVEGSF